LNENRISPPPPRSLGTNQTGGGDNSYNGALHVEDDGHALLLKPFGMAYLRGTNHDERMTMQGFIGILLGLFIRAAATLTVQLARRGG
jgi:hypothetical protein